VECFHKKAVSYIRKKYIFFFSEGYTHLRGHAVAQLVEALRYKPKFAGSNLDGVIDIIIPAALWPWV
jgi:hypothetical protein